MKEKTFYRHDPTKNTGIIYESDFYTNYPISKNIAERIIKDWKDDEKYRKNLESLNRRIK